MDDSIRMGWNQFVQLGDCTFETRKLPVLIESITLFKILGNE